MGHTIERDWLTNAGLRALCLWVNNSHRCGYVGIPPGHPLHGVGYSEETDRLLVAAKAAEGKPAGKRGILSPVCAMGKGTLSSTPELVFDVHGSLTYSGGGDGYPVDGPEWWLGFDCNHAGDGSATYNALSGDPIRDEEYVVAECESLAAQLVAYIRSRVPKGDLMTPTPKPSERGMAAANDIINAFAFYSKTTRQAEFAVMLDEHFRGHDELLAICRAVNAFWHRECRCAERGYCVYCVNRATLAAIDAPALAAAKGEETEQ